MLDITFARPALPKSGALVLLAEEEGEPDAIRAAADTATGGAVSRALEAAEFKPKPGKTCTILAPGAGLSRIVVVGIGKRAELTPHTAGEAGGAVAAALAREPAAAVAAAGLTAELTVALAAGAALRSYRFDRYRTTQKPEDRPRLARLNVLAADLARTRDAWASLRAVVEGVHLARDLVSEPPNVLTPAELAERCRALEPLGLKIEVLGPRELAKLGFGALLGVAQGSANEPRMVILHWHGASGGATVAKGRRPRAARPLAFVGKGVTFDTGGISIKPAQGMEDMKYDMAGAGAVIGLMAALAGRRAKVDAVGLVGLVENMPSGTAQRPGDVVKTYSGQTVEVINTDAEGRLVLADVLWYTQEKFEPRCIIDVATLTGAMVVSLGHDYAGLFSNDNDLAQRLHEAGEATGERIWRMPLAEVYDKQIKSDIADMKNVGGRPASAITAAQFLQRFVNGKPWAHLDIAGTAWSSKDNGLVPKGATGFGVRLLDRLVAEHYED
jgi:leucyl aminopeptidase